MKTFFKKLECRILVESTKIENASCLDTNLSSQKPMLRQIKWWLQHKPITKDGVFPVTTLFFLKILFQFKNLL